MNENYVPTARLRFVARFGNEKDPEVMPTAIPRYVLQQWWAEPMPGYMRDVAKGEWRDVALEAE